MKRITGVTNVRIIQLSSPVDFQNFAINGSVDIDGMKHNYDEVLKIRACFYDMILFVI